jgi:hypothetical protein
MTEDIIAVGYRWAGEVPVSGGSFLQRGRLLRLGV